MNVDFNIDIDREKNILTINSVQAGAGFGQVATKGAVVPLKKDSATPLNANVLASKLDLGKIQPYAVLFGVCQKKCSWPALLKPRLP